MDNGIHKQGRIRVDLPLREEDVVLPYYKLCAIRGIRKEDALYDLLKHELDIARESGEFTEDQDWMSWGELQKAMLHSGFSINRSVFWTYEKRGLLDGLTKTNGQNKVYDFLGILNCFSTGKIAI